ncbi:MAG: PorT family protein [Bacteroidales bacterium]|nr:PorT family protein [Bacteroidales bacterium]
MKTHLLITNRRKETILLLLMVVLFPFLSFSQQKPLNLPRYDERRIHFGFNLGYNQFFALLKVKDPLPQPDKVIGMNIEAQPGFQVGVIGDLKLFEYLRLRLSPTISFGDRKFNFNTINSKGEHKIEKTNIEAIYLETPLELKIQAKRWRNFRPYIIAGGKYCYDLASLKKKKISEEDMVLRVENNDWMYTLGAGFDFYLQYFKLGIELKSSFSLTNMHIAERHKPFSNIIDTYKTRIFYLSFTFE